MFKRILSLMLVAMLAIALAACSPGSNEPSTQETPGNSNTSGNQASQDGESQTERMEISVSVLDFGSFPSDLGTLEDNALTQWINENSPVSVRFVPITRSEAITKYTTMMAADSAPDIIMEWNINAFEQFAVTGVLQPLDDVFAEYGANLQDATPEDVLRYGYSNGKLYGIPKLRSETSVACFMGWIRQDWLDALGLSMPTTMDEFYTVMEAFTYSDPDQNGVDDTWGFGAASGESGSNDQFGGCERIIQLFGAMRDSWIPGEDGLLDYADITVNRLEGVKFVERIYDNGLCNPEFFTQTAQQSVADFINGRTGYMGGMSGLGTDMLTAMWEINPDANPVPLATLTSPLGQFAYYKERSVDIMNMVPTSCEHPEAVIMYLDWMISGPWEYINYRDEGVWYEKVDGAIIPIGDPTERGRQLSHAAQYTLVTPYNQTAENVKTELAYKADSITDVEKRSIELNIMALEETFKHDFIWYTPTNTLGIDIVAEKLPSLQKFSTDTWQQAIIDRDLTAEDAYELIKQEYEALGYAEVRKAYNDKALELGYIE